MFNKTKSWVFSHKILSAVIVFFTLIIISILLTPVPPKSTVENGIKTEAEQKVVFDVPSLFNKNIDEVKQVLGAPENYPEPTAEQIKLGTKTWEKTFKKDGIELLVTYNILDKKVTDFFVSATDEIYDKTDKSRMLQLTNTQENGSAYSVEFVKAMKDPSKFTGILIKQN
jgi:hypothetical protein